MRVITTFSVDENCLKMIDAYAARLEMDRSKFLCWAAVHFGECKHGVPTLEKNPLFRIKRRDGTERIPYTVPSQKPTGEEAPIL